MTNCSQSTIVASFYSKLEDSDHTKILRPIGTMRTLEGRMVVRDLHMIPELMEMGSSTSPLILQFKSSLSLQTQAVLAFS